MTERDYTRSAAMALEDRLARELRECEEVLKFEADVGKRRIAAARYIALTDPKEQAA